jgi:hypothetical protein
VSFLGVASYIQVTSLINWIPILGPLAALIVLTWVGFTVFN